MRILVAEDEPKIANSLKQGLEQEGFGLSLSIAKEIVNVHGGNIGVQSVMKNDETKTTFTVKLTQSST